MSKSYTIGGFMSPRLVVSYDGVPPCLYCGAPVVSPSMDGPLVCPTCDGGRNADGSPWTADENRARHEHKAARLAEIAALPENAGEVARWKARWGR